MCGRGAINGNLKLEAQRCLKVRPATAADIPALLALEQQCPTAAHWSRQRYEALFRTPVESPRRLVLAIDDDETDGNRNENDRSSKSAESESPSPRLLGFLIAHEIHPDWELENLVTAPSSRRKGLATRLFTALLKHAHKANCESVFIEVRESNQAARTLYARLGFQENGRRKRYYANPPEDAVLYRLALIDPSPWSDSR